MICRRNFMLALSSLTTLTTVGFPAKAKDLGTVTSPGFVLPANATDCHSHIFDPERFPYVPNRRYTPPPATVGDLLRMHDAFGIQREVLVQPSVYGTDNSCMLAALQQLGARARGIAVIDKSFSRSQLDDLIAAGVRGVRINLEVNKDADPSLAIERIKQTADQLAGTGLMIVVYAAMPVVVACAATLSAVPNPVLIDHFGLAKSAGGTTQSGFVELLNLMKSPNVFMKLSGPYQISNQSPAYSDITPIAKAMIAASPERVVWGSDWPHTGGANRPANYKPTDIEHFRVEDDGRDIGLILDWAPDAPQRQKLLVSNPARLFGFN
jgi:2-pyrone-4,6-dicarboxylate lactonase